MVVSNRLGLSESVSDGVTGLVVSAFDIVVLSIVFQRRIYDRDLRASMSAAPVQRIRSSFLRSRQVEGLRNVTSVVAGWLSIDHWSF